MRDFHICEEKIKLFRHINFYFAGDIRDRHPTIANHAQNMSQNRRIFQPTAHQTIILMVIQMRKCSLHSLSWYTPLASNLTLMICTEGQGGQTPSSSTPAVLKVHGLQDQVKSCRVLQVQKTSCNRVLFIVPRTRTTFFGMLTA